MQKSALIFLIKEPSFSPAGSADALMDSSFLFQAINLSTEVEFDSAPSWFHCESGPLAFIAP